VLDNADHLIDNSVESSPQVAQGEDLLANEPLGDTANKSMDSAVVPAHAESVDEDNTLQVEAGENDVSEASEEVKDSPSDAVEENQSEETELNTSQELSEKSEEELRTIFDVIQNGTFSNENMTISNGTHDPNTTTTSKPAIRWPCNPLTNISIDQLVKSDQESIDSSVIIINNETMLTNLISAMNRTKVCGLLLFYSPFCEFCTNLAPLYNAVGRSYKDILVIASDAQNVMGVSAKYGIVGIPTILLFHSGKAVAKYNRSRTAADFREFILQLTGVRPSIPLNVTQDDSLGPLTSTLKESRDYYLIFSICFIAFVVLKGLAPFIKDSTIRVYRCIGTLFVRPKVD